MVEKLGETLCEGGREDVSKGGSLVELSVVVSFALLNTKRDSKLRRGSSRQVRRNEAFRYLLGDAFLAGDKFEFDLPKSITLSRAANDAHNIIVYLSQDLIALVVERHSPANSVELDELSERLAPDDASEELGDAWRKGALTPLPGHFDPLPHGSAER